MNSLPAGSSRPSSFAACVCLVFLAFAACWYFRQPPKLGDDLDYWKLAMDLHLGLPNAWNPDSFHDLRWPVWGVCWVLMIPLGLVPATYFLQPALYLAAGACLIYWIGGRVGLPFWGRVAAGVFFVMHPLIDTALMRPMPDLSEGFWVAASFALWLAMTSESVRWKKVLFCAAVGLVLAVAQANRITGVFAIPVLIAATLVIHPRQIGWLILCGVFALGFVAVEAAIYWSLTGDWLHSLNANLGARGRKGTEPVPLWSLPFRFMNSLWRQPHDSLMSVLAVGGFGFYLLRKNPAGRALVVWAVVYYLTFSCAVQSFNPPRPLVRDGDRFLASLAFPLSLLSAGGVMFLWSLIPRTWKQPAAFFEKRPWLVLILFVPFMALLGDRTTGVPDYLAEIRTYIEKQQPGAVILSHPPMRAVAQLAAPDVASKLDWRLFRNILEPSPELLSAMDDASGIWLIRKHSWITNRKASETGDQDRLPELAPYLTPPFDGWEPSLTVLKGDVPDFLFLSKSPEGKPMEKLDLTGLLPLPQLPARWEFTKDSPREDWRFGPVNIPPNLQGREVFLFLRYSSGKTEPARLWLEFEGENTPEFLTFKPYLFSETSPDFFAFRIPEGAESVSLRIRRSPATRWIAIDHLEIYSPPDKP